VARTAALASVACLAVAALILLTLDPEQPLAVAAFIAAVGGGAAAFATWLQVRAARSRRRGAGARGAIAGRRGLEVGAVVALLLWLRAVDGLSLITAAFVVLTFVATEFVLTAGPNSSR
jgi:hypothetical protein